MGLALVTSAALGCTPLDPEEDTYDSLTQPFPSDDDPGAPPTGQAADWSCLGEPVPTPPSNLPRTVTYTFPLVEWLTGNPVPNRTITVCNRLDSGCASPLPAPFQADDDAEIVSVELPTGLPIYLILKAPGVIPTVLYFDGPLYSNQLGGRIQFLTLASLGGIAAQTQIALDPTLGMIAARPHDCKGNIVEGALYKISDTIGTSIPYTFVNGLLRTAEPPAPSPETLLPSDYSPWAGFANVPVGKLTVSGVLANDDREFGTADISIFGGFMNAVEIRAANRL